MAEFRINWKRGDYIKLGRAVSDFNKKVRRLQAEENKLYLPDEIDYKRAKEEVTTRRELNRLINSLRRFQKEGAEELYITEAGEEMSRWERKELGIQSRIAQQRLRHELKALNEPLESGFSRAQMGSQRVKEIEAQLKNLKQIESKVGYEFKMLKERIKKTGVSDFEMKKAITYRENYLKVLEKYSHYDNYELLMNKLKSIVNPIAFFNYVSETELTVDLTYQSEEYYTQENFNGFIESLGITIENDSVSSLGVLNKYSFDKTVQNINKDFKNRLK